MGSPICSCQRETGSWDVRIVERTWHRSLQISQNSRPSGSLSLTGRLRKLPSVAESPLRIRPTELSFQTGFRAFLGRSFSRFGFAVRYARNIPDFVNAAIASDRIDGAARVKVRVIELDALPSGPITNLVKP